MVETEAGHSVVARFESHGSHPGLHGHSHCDRGGIEIGASGLDANVYHPGIMTEITAQRGMAGPHIV